MEFSKKLKELRNKKVYHKPSLRQIYIFHALLLQNGRMAWDCRMTIRSNY